MTLSSHTEGWQWEKSATTKRWDYLYCMLLVLARTSTQAVVGSELRAMQIALATG